MALFQPTNVIPSALSGEGNGTVDVTKPLTVSWQVNGNSPMVAYRIKIMQNDTDSTLKLDTGKVTLSSPFSGADRMGVPVPFSTVITAAQMSTAGMENGYENGYKMTIEQWWTANDSVTQTSASYFITRSTPVVTMASIPYADSFRYLEYTFSAYYTQAQNDAAEWCRWELQALENGEYVSIDDTGYIYNAGMTMYMGYYALQYTYTGFSMGMNGHIGVPGVQYRLRCTVQTENGVQGSTGWEYFVTQNLTDSSPVSLRVCPMKDRDAIRITMAKNFPVLGKSTGTYSYTFSLNADKWGMQLDAGSTVTWGEEGENSLDIRQSPYVIMTKGNITDAGTPNTYMTAHYTDKDLTFSYDSNGFSIHYGTDKLWETAIQPVTGSKFGIAILSDTVYFYLNDSGNVQTAQDTIAPWQNEEMYALSIAGPMYFKATVISQGDIEFARFYFFAEYESAALEMKENTLLMISYNHTLFTGANNIGYSSLYDEPWAASYTYMLAICKKEAGSEILSRVADIYLDGNTKDTVIYDYAVKNQQEYEYYLIYIDHKPINQYGYMNTHDGVAKVTPCFWNYTVLCCEQNNIGDYIVKNEYRFALDITSGNVGNNNSPSIQQNFTRYPTRQPVSNQYRSGTLSAFIGKVENDQYVDTARLMDELYALSTDGRPKFLKTRKGQVMRIEVSAPVVMNIGDKFAQQPAKISLPWVEIGNVENVNILGGDTFAQDVPTFDVYPETMELQMTYSESSAMGENSFELRDGDLYLMNSGVYDEGAFSLNSNMEVILNTD